MYIMGDGDDKMKYIYSKDRTFIFEDNKDNRNNLRSVKVFGRMTAMEKIKIAIKCGSTHITLVSSYHTARHIHPFSSGTIFKYYNLLNGKFVHYRSGSMINR